MTLGSATKVGGEGRSLAPPQHSYRQDVVTTPTRHMGDDFITRPVVDILRQALNP